MLEISHELTRIFTKTSFPFFHRRGAEAAESDYFLFAVERTANKKTHTLRAKHKSVSLIARIGIITN
jgi:hypothetical protein